MYESKQTVQYTSGYVQVHTSTVNFAYIIHQIYLHIYRLNTN